MNLLTICAVCQMQNGVPNFGTLEAVPVPEDGVIRNRCPSGHENWHVLQPDRYELLSELAVIAIRDGYYRESVASFSAALERLYEYYSIATLRLKGVHSEAVATIWKGIRNSSERQFGAFVGLYAAQHGRVPPSLPERWVHERNAVVHKGKFPSKDEAIAFGQAVADVAKIVLTELRSPTYEAVIRTLVSERLAAGVKLARDNGAIPSQMTLSTPFSIIRPNVSIDVATLVAERAARPDFAKTAEEGKAFQRVIEMMQPKNA